MPHVDFHLHTTTSDGVWTPEQMFAFMRESGIETFSITDHDTMDVYPLPGDLAAKSIPGMEVDTKCEGSTSHLLVYGIRHKDAPLLERLRAQREARFGRMEAIVEKLRASGIAVTMDDVAAQAGAAQSLGRPHLARALVKLGVVPDVQTAFDRYIADDKDGFVSLDRLESADAIALAHESGAIVSVAHPKRLREPRLLEVLRAEGIDGVEVIHPSADADMEREYREYAVRHGLLVTGGTDFHAPSPGYQPGTTSLTADDVARLLDAVGEAAA